MYDTSKLLRKSSMFLADLEHSAKYICENFRKLMKNKKRYFAIAIVC